MPCRYEGPEETSARLRAELDKVTRMLCEVLRKRDLYAIPPITLSQETRNWWAEHQERDRQRALRETAAKIRAGRAAVILSKLSPEEIRELGLESLSEALRGGVEGDQGPRGV